MLCCAVLGYAMLCYTMLCYAMLCYAMPGRKQMAQEVKAHRRLAESSGALGRELDSMRAELLEAQARLTSAAAQAAAGRAAEEKLTSALDACRAEAAEALA